jgi:membrane protease YdiL (CAAX protease family)
VKNQSKAMQRLMIFVVVLVCGISLPSLSGLLVFPFSIVPSGFTLIYSVVISFLFLLIAAVLHYRKFAKRYWQLFVGFSVASFAILLDLIFNLSSESIVGLVLDMLLSTLIIVGVIILLTRFSGNSMNSIFLSWGNLKWGLIIGLVGFFVFALVAIPGAEYLFQGQNLNFGKVVAWLPWITIIVLANGIREEILYRGLFLKKFDVLLGSKASNLAQALFFSLSHSVAGLGLFSYSSSTLALVVITFVLGLVWGYVMQRTNSVIGSILFHAGTDIPIFIGIFSNLF